MALETSTTISGLVSANPTAIDAVSQGDDHLRLIKSVLKAQFPGAGGTGFSIPITATEAEINQLAGLIAGSIPSGTKMPFYQAAPPVGWTATAIQNDSMMRVVTSATTGGTSGAGSGHSPILNNVVTSHTHVFTGSALGTHLHVTGDHAHESALIQATGPFGVGAFVTGGYPVGQAFNASTLTSGMTTSPNTSSTSAGTPAGTNAVPAGAANWAPKYMSFCVGTKT